jgi:hypothetical protein
MDKKLISEEINKLRLLMGYKPSSTLTENVDSIGIISESEISEQKGQALIKSIFGTADDAAIKASSNYRAVVNMFDDVAKNVGRVTDDAGRAISTGDDLVQALARGRINNAAELSKVAKGLLKGGKVQGNARKLLTDKAADLTIKDARYANMSKKQIENTLKKKGYDPSIADEIASKVELKRGGKGGGGGGGRGGGGGGRKPPPPLPPLPNIPPWWRRAWNWLTKTKWGRRIMIAGGIAAAYLLWKSFTDEGDDLADCLKGYVSDTAEFEKFLNDGYITINGIKFYPDGTAELGGGKGKWVDNGTEVIATIAGVSKSVPCKKLIPVVTTTTTGGPNPGPYKPCTSFPYEKFCKSDKISDVQACLGLKADGKLGPGTEKALKAKGYSVPLTQSDYDKIMANCKGNSVTTTTTTEAVQSDVISF